tara:strand:+ start:555 stop:1400 length:846 start_codon:yes stop_codon:yes gene_type:complete
MQLKLTDQQQTEYVLMQSIEEDCFVDTNEKIEYPPVALSLGEKLIKSPQGDSLLPIPIATFGNLSTIQAPPKTKKTFFVSLLASAFLSGKNHFSADIKGHRDNKTLLHIDTEQGKWHASRVFKRTIDMSGMSDVDFYHTYALRTLGYKERIQFIEYCLAHKFKNIGLIFIDGIADLVSDVNNLQECNLIVQKLMEWSASYNCHITCVIHSNFGSDKPTGHLGSLLEKKSETQIQLEANTVNKELVTVRCKRSRNFSFDTFSFKVNEKGYPEVVGDLYDPLK